MAIRVLAAGNSNITQADHRSLITSFAQPASSSSVRAGLFPSNNPAQLSNVSSMVAGISGFKAIVPNQSGSGYYLVQSDTVQNVTFDPGEAGVARTDRIIVRVYNDSQDASGRNDVVVEYLKGQSSGSASALPNGSLVLWEIPVPAGASSGGGGINFTTIGVDVRAYTSSVGGIIPVANNAGVTAIQNPFRGMAAYVLATDILYVYDSVFQWRARGQVSVSTFANLNTILNPYDGLVVTTRDTNRLYIHDGSNWIRNEYAEVASKTLMGSTSTLSSGAYANIPGASTLSLVKSRLDTKVRVDMKFSFFLNGTSTGLQLGVTINGVDYDVAKGYVTSTTQYHNFSGFAIVTNNLIPGTYAVQPRWKRFSGTGDITVGAGVSELDVSVRESN